MFHQIGFLIFNYMVIQIKLLFLRNIEKQLVLTEGRGTKLTKW